MTIDTIRSFGVTLYVEFAQTGQTGNVSAMALNQGITLQRDGLRLLGQHHGSATAFVVDEFLSDAQAQVAHRVLQRAMTQFLKKARRSQRVKSFVLWGVMPLTALIFALAAHMAAARPSTAGVAVGAAASASEVKPSEAPKAQTTTHPKSDPAIASAMRAGMAKDKFSVQLSQGMRGTLYVFSDPACPHCRDFEAQLERLAKDYTVHVFPVSVIGGARSDEHAAQLFCGTPKDRRMGWKRLMTGGVLDAPPCSEGMASAATNNRMFKAIGLQGTPAIVTDDGRVVPDTVALTAEGLDAWLQASLTPP
jgi:TrbB protein